MLVLAIIAATAAAQPAAGPPRPRIRQATATVRILSGVRIKPDRPPREAIVTDVELRSADGSRQQSRHIEFP